MNLPFSDVCVPNKDMVMSIAYYLGMYLSFYVYELSVARVWTNERMNEPEICVVEEECVSENNYNCVSHELLKPHIVDGPRNVTYINSCWGTASELLFCRNTLHDRKFLSAFAELFRKEKHVSQPNVPICIRFDFNSKLNTWFCQILKTKYDKITGKSISESIASIPGALMLSASTKDRNGLWGKLSNCLLGTNTQHDRTMMSRIWNVYKEVNKNIKNIVINADICFIFLCYIFSTQMKKLQVKLIPPLLQLLWTVLRVDINLVLRIKVARNKCESTDSITLRK